jgi:integrase
MAWTARELSSFLTSATGHCHHRTWWLAAHTGLRRSELVGLRWRDIDLDHKRLSVTRTIVAVNGHMHTSNGKTANAGRTIDLDTSTVHLLARWRHDHIQRFGAANPERGLLVRDDGEPINPQTISQGFDRAVTKTTLPRLSLHGLRHTHATLLLKAGVPLKVVSERLGHSTHAGVHDGDLPARPTGHAGRSRSDLRRPPRHPGHRPLRRGRRMSLLPATRR